VTALLLGERCGGEILKRRLPEGWRFYDRIDGRVVDLPTTRCRTPRPDSLRP